MARRRRTREPSPPGGRAVHYHRPPLAVPDVAPLPPPAGFSDRVRTLGFEVRPGDIERLGHFLALLLAGTRLMNLTAIRDPVQAWERHILDSLTLVPLLSPLPAGAHVADVGSGGGLPGMPLAIVMSALRFTLIEATAKKARFLEQVVARLGLTNVAVINDRAERVGREPDRREQFDAVVARAVGPLATVAELTVPLARIHAPVLLIKGQRVGDELTAAGAALSRLGVSFQNLVPTPTGQIVVLRKHTATPRQFPRPPGIPARFPLQ